MYFIRYDEPASKILYYKSHLEPTGMVRAPGTSNGLTINWTIDLSDACRFRTREEAEKVSDDICFGEVIEV
jgi:hypothetical protein